MDVIASGPFVPDSSTFEDALGILRKYDLKDVPESIVRRLEDGSQGRIPDTPKEGDPVFLYVSNVIVGSNMLALEAAQEKANEFGYDTLILSSLIEGETRDVARVHCAILREICRTGRPIAKPACIISGGETTVTIRGKGLGGRNQEFCLASAIEIAELPDKMVVLSGGTDGNDGPTDAAGAVVDPHTVERGKRAGLSAIDYLNNNDAYHFLSKDRRPSHNWPHQYQCNGCTAFVNPLGVPFFPLLHKVGFCHLEGGAVIFDGLFRLLHGHLLRPDDKKKGSCRNKGE